jgi:hypothetical protein
MLGKLMLYNLKIITETLFLFIHGLVKMSNNLKCSVWGMWSFRGLVGMLWPSEASLLLTSAPPYVFIQSR